MTELSADDARLQSNQAFGEQVCQAMSDALLKLGFARSDLPSLPEFTKAQYNLVQDPYSREENLTGYWYNQHKHKIGSIQFLSDGMFYAEYDVVLPHPRKKQWFVEAITAWGKNGQIKTEAKLLATPQ